MQSALDDSTKSPGEGYSMKPLRIRLQESRARLGLSWEILERDYVLSWVLAGISHVDSLRDTLVFKGGTALKKCYFGDYRISEDLDFSGLKAVPTGKALEKAMQLVTVQATSLLEEYAPVEMICERYTEKQPHPGGQEAFVIRARMPWQQRVHMRVMVEVSVDEEILKPTESRKIIHEYGEPIESQVRVYALEEIIAEKLRAILQHVEKLEKRGWSRSRARDYYDIWRILGTYREQMDLSNFASLLEKKCAYKGVSFSKVDDFFSENMISYVERTWEQWLGPLVLSLPSFDTVISEVHQQVSILLSRK
jgi:predicted nucleotidyltransferase component of viral defense system